jgi:hypothetical protein
MTDLRKAAEMALRQLQKDDVYLGHRSKTRADSIEALRQALANEALERGTKAWADVPNASDWVDELRGNDKPPVKTYCGGRANYCTPEETPEVTPEVTTEVTGEVPCKTDPNAPHGFARNASHSADRYVCECEGWEPVDNVYMSEERVHKTDKSIHDPVVGTKTWVEDGKVFTQNLHASDIYITPPKWVGLTDEDLKPLCDVYKSIFDGYMYDFSAAIEAKLKEKNCDS